MLRSVPLCGILWQSGGEINMLDVWVAPHVVGSLDRHSTEAGDYTFAYRSAIEAGEDVSLTMPWSLESYRYKNGLHPVFQMDLPTMRIACWLFCCSCVVSRRGMRCSVSRSMRSIWSIPGISTTGIWWIFHPNTLLALFCTCVTDRCSTSLSHRKVYGREG